MAGKGQGHGHDHGHGRDQGHDHSHGHGRSHGQGHSHGGDHDRYLAFAFAWADLIVETDGETVTFLSGAVEPLLGHPASHFIGKKIEDLFVPADHLLVPEVCAVLQKHGRVSETNVTLLKSDGSQTKARMTGHALRLGHGENLFIAIRTNLRTPDAVAEKMKRDDTTGLYTAENFNSLVASRVKKLAEKGEDAEVAMVSLNGLTHLREDMAEADYESLVATVGATVRANSIDGDTAAAIDEERYSLIVPKGEEVTKIETEISGLISEVDKKGRVQIAAAAMKVGDTAKITEDDLAKGLLYTLQKFQATEGAMDLKTLADQMTPLVDQTIDQIVNFRSLVTGQQFDIALQPIITIKGGEIHHFEALCRFLDLGKEASPFQVINFAEETGLIHQFDLAMVGKVVNWLNKLPRNNEIYHVAVNVSGYSVGQESYVDGLFDLLRRNEWTKGKLSFEITESARMSDLPAANEFIQRLRREGYEVCLDDFGAGSASFQYLASLDVDIVKLDGSAVKSAEASEKGTAFLSALCELCRRLGVETVAEMVDSQHTLNFVRQCGVDYVQGWMFGKPSTDVKSFMPYPNKNLLTTKRR